MTRRNKVRGVQHGAALEAPSEFGFVTSDSPPPAAVAPRPETRTSGSSPRHGTLQILWTGVRLSLGLAVIASISLAIAWGAHRYALTSPRFAIREFTVVGNRHHSADQLARLAAIERGHNLFAVDTEAAERRILESPWVRRARVGRELPATIRIEVMERDAVALAAIEGSLYLVTADGEPFKAFEGKDPGDLPVLTGVGGRELSADRARAVERLALGLQVLRDYGLLPIARVYEPEEVNLAEDGGVILTVGKRGIALHLGIGPFRQKLLMAARILSKLQPGGQLPGIVFLDNEAHPERVVVRMR